MKQPTNPRKALLLSALLHVIVLIILVGSLEFSGPLLVVSNNDAQVINAVALQDSPILAPPTKPVEIKPVDKPIEKMDPSDPLSPKPAPAEAAAKKVEPPTQDKKLAIRDAHKKADSTKKLLADLESEISKQAKSKQKKLKNKFHNELRAQSEKALEQFMKEQKPAAGRRAQNTQGIVDKYKALILHAISQEWVVPSHVNKRLFCELLIRLAPGGVVLDVQVTRSSGDILLDRSAQAAVFKASPLPVPDDIISFEPFHEFVLKVKPENVLENKGDQSFWIG